MKRALVLGGYGGFGARLSRRLSADGWFVIVAGRDGGKARRMASLLVHAEGVSADRDADLSAVLLHYRPDLLIDAAGPFQASGYQVAEACIAHGVAYLDLADARDFVGGISVLDEPARSAGTVVVCGGSSVPALSGAVVKHLSAGMDEVRSIAMSVSASNRATAGASVARAILSHVGKPIRLWSGRRWIDKTGWQKLHRQTYRVAGHRPIHRFVALTDVPDHDIMPESTVGMPATAFFAGPEFAFQIVALWFASWPVRWGWVSSATPLARWLLPLQMLTARLGTDRSAMVVEIKGIVAGKAELRRWTLIAEDGDGPEIPTIAAQLLARQLAAGRLEPGARHAAGLLSLTDFEAEFQRLAIVHETARRPYVPLYHRVLGDAFEKLSPAVRTLHGVVGDGGADGTAIVTRGKAWSARLVAAALGFPRQGEHQLHVSFEEKDGVEHWSRDFSGQVFSSELSQSGRYLVERFGPLRFYFDLPVADGGLSMVMCKWSVFHLRLPLFLAPKSRAREWGEGTDFCFDVPISLPLIGDIVHYSGRLRQL